MISFIFFIYGIISGRILNVWDFIHHPINLKAIPPDAIAISPGAQKIYTLLYWVNLAIFLGMGLAFLYLTLTYSEPGSTFEPKDSSEEGKPHE